MSTYQRIALAGATGNLGPYILDALVSAGFDVTVLTRDASKAKLPANVKAVTVDYSSQDSIVSAIKGHDVFICNLPQHDQQPALIDAAIAAGVKRFIPSEFGSNIIGNAKTAALPVFAGKKLTQEYLRAKQDQISWTVIVNMGFFQWCLERGIFVSLKGGPTEVLDGGDVPFTVTTLPAVGRAVVGVLRHPAETQNRAVYVHSATLTQKQILAVAEKANPAIKPEIQNISADDLLARSFALLKEGGDKILPAIMMQIQVSAASAAYGPHHAAKNDNALLGVQELSEKEVEEEIAKVARAGQISF